MFTIFSEYFEELKIVIVFIRAQKFIELCGFKSMRDKFVGGKSKGLGE